METQLLVKTDPPIYLEHILHGQIEEKAFWLEQMAEWETDLAGNTPFEQFELILREVSVYEYICSIFNIESTMISVCCIEFGKGVILEIDEIKELITVAFSSGYIQRLSRNQFISNKWSISFLIKAYEKNSL